MYYPYPGDTFAVLPDDSIRAAPYQHAQGQPALIIDGVQREIPAEPTEYDSVFGNYIAAARTESSFVDLQVSGRAGTGRCTVVVTAVKLNDEPLNPNLRLYCVVTEDSVFDFLGGRRDLVARRFLPSVDGVPLGLERRRARRCDTLVFDPAGTNPCFLRAVAFVQDPVSRAVLQSAQSPRFLTGR